MNYEQLKEERQNILTEQHQLQNKLDEINNNLKVMPEHTFDFLDFKKNIIQENAPYLHNLILKISKLDNDERSLEWGRGKNIVDYSGIEFEYNNIRYTTGRAYNWCTSEYLYTEYNRADSSYFDLSEYNIDELNHLWINEEYSKFEEYLKLNVESELEQICLLIFISQNLMQW